MLPGGVDSFTGIHPFLLVLAAAGLDRWIGDPRWCLHPVVVMGWWITQLRRLAERCCGDSPLGLRLAGGGITLLLVLGSSGFGWWLEQRSREWPWPIGAALLLIALASALAGRSLEQAVQAVLEALTNTSELDPARQALSWIVGRDTRALNRQEILRAAAETASENAVDGLFAPLFWMLIGAARSGRTAGQVRWPSPGDSRRRAPSIRCSATAGGPCVGWGPPGPSSMTCWSGCPAGSSPSACLSYSSIPPGGSCPWRGGPCWRAGPIPHPTRGSPRRSMPNAWGFNWGASIATQTRRPANRCWPLALGLSLIHISEPTRPY